MIAEWRPALYPLGLLGSSLFALRFLIQWIQSEQRQCSHTSRLFWQISLAGNVVMLIHGTLQLQLPVAGIQAINTACCWRQLRLSSHPGAPWRQLPLFMGILVLVLLGFFYQAPDPHAWTRTPTLPFKLPTGLTLPWYLHLVGFSAMCLFALRFWLHWWQSEQGMITHLGPLFWKLSLTGAILSLCYYLPQLDVVNILAYSIGIIPYTRNLVLANKSQHD